MLYTVNYDLIKYKDYPTLWDALKRLGAQRVLLSTWVMRNRSSAVELRDYLQKFIDSDDRLLVTEIVETNWAGRNLLVRPDAV